MKKILYTLLLFSFSLGYSQLDEGQRISFDFIKVEKENIEEYENSLLKEMEFEKRKLRIY